MLLTNQMRLCLVGVMVAVQATGGAEALSRGQATTVSRSSQPSSPTPTEVQAPADYVIGPDDVLHVMFWRDEKLTADVAVRPDGMIDRKAARAGARVPPQNRAAVH